MADRVKIFALGGLDEKGRDCYICEINNDIFVLDAGISIPDKNFPGVDCLLPNFGYLIKNKDKIKAYILTHGHDENMGALKFFYKYAPAPVFCTDTTRVVMESQMLIHHQYAKVDYHIVKASDDVVVAGRKISFFQTCHNAANSFGVAIYTDQGNIVYTSDYIINFATDEDNFKFDLAKAAKLAEQNTLLLLAESTSGGKNGYCSPKHRLSPLIEKYFKMDKRILITCYWENMYRLREISRLIKKYNKKLYCYDEYTSDVLKNVILAGTSIQISPDQIVKKEDLLRIKKSELVILLLGHSDDIYDEINALGNTTNSDQRILIDKDDVFINAALPAQIYETKCTRSIDNLYRTGCEVVWIKNKDISPMHAREDDLRFVINLFKPKFFFPVRGHYTEIMANAKHAVALGVGLNYNNVFVLDNGMELILDGTNRPQIIPYDSARYDISPILVDGKGMAKMSDDVINVRQRLGVDGTVVIASTVSLAEKRIIAGPDCQMRGFVYVKDAEPLLKSISQIYVDEINLALSQNVKDFTQTKEIINDRIKKFIRRENGREPYIDSIIIAK
ncbi:MAG: ribonuclease J [Bacilli bacterium]|nr:ribonuclease J [Bacilli bacterium]